MFSAELILTVLPRLTSGLTEGLPLARAGLTGNNGSHAFPEMDWVSSSLVDIR